MDVENNEFLHFVVLADEQQLDYLLIGGLALILNGVVRITRDADIWLRPDNDNRDRFINVLLAYGYTEEEVQPMRIADFTQPQIIRIFDIPMDVLTSVHQRFDYAACKQRAKSFRTNRGQTIYFLHINDLREAKVLARRTKDLNDILLIDELIDEIKKREGRDE